MVNVAAAAAVVDVILPRRPRKLNSTYIAANAMHLVSCTWLYELGSMHLALCTSMHGSMHLAPCTWLYVFDSAQVTLCKLVRELRARCFRGRRKEKTPQKNTHTHTPT